MLDQIDRIGVRKKPGPKPRTHCIVCGSAMSQTVVSDQLRSHCDECRKLRQRCRRVGITITEYHRVYKLQQGLCASCGINQATHLDHNHVTNKFRAIVCNGCNLLIGWVEKSSSDILQKVEAYLASY